MHLSKQDLPRELEQQLTEALYQLIADVKTKKQAKIVLTDLISETERSAIIKRLGIAIHLSEGKSYDHIKNKLKVSTATIAHIQEHMGNVGLQYIIESVNLDLKSSQIATKLKLLFNIK